MAVTWRQLAGSTDRFALEVSLADDPDEGRGAERSLAASWGEFTFYLDGRNLCEAKDPTGLTLPGVRWYLLPLISFFIRNWEPLIHQERLPRVPREGTSAAAHMASLGTPPATYDDRRTEEWNEDWWIFFTEHCLASAREGGIFPNIWFRRTGDDIEISWDNDSNPAETPLRFLERSGTATVPAEDFCPIVFKVLEATLAELLTRAETAELLSLETELASIGTPPSDRQWFRHALLLNLRRDAQAALQFAQTLTTRAPGLLPRADGGLFLPASLPALVFGSASPTLREDDILMIVDHFDTSRAEPLESRLFEIVAEVPCPFVQPWKSGYQLARQLRDKLGLGYGPVDMHDLLEAFDISIRPIELSDPGIRAISFVSIDVVPTVLINNLSPRAQQAWARAATLAHEFCHLVYDRRVGRAFGTSSGPWAPVRFEQRANAFAIMFLMPEPALLETFTAATGSLGERVKMVTRHFGANYRATIHHLHNLHLIERFERDALLDDVDASSL